LILRRGLGANSAREECDARERNCQGPRAQITAGGRQAIHGESGGSEVDGSSEGDARQGARLAGAGARRLDIADPASGRKFGN
jgi:hypothetical protein